MSIKIKISGKKLKAALTKVKPFNFDPANGYRTFDSILLKTDVENSVLIIKTFNSKIGLKTMIPCEIIEHGSVILKLSSDDTLIIPNIKEDIILSYDNEKLEITAENISKQSFPISNEFLDVDLKSNHPLFSIKEKEFSEYLKSSIKLIKNKCVSEYLKGYLFDINGNDVKLISSDGYQINILKTHCYGYDDNSLRFILPANFAKLISSVFKKTKIETELEYGICKYNNEERYFLRVYNDEYECICFIDLNSETNSLYDISIIENQQSFLSFDFKFDNAYEIISEFPKINSIGSCISLNFNLDIEKKSMDIEILSTKRETKIVENENEIESYFIGTYPISTKLSIPIDNFKFDENIIKSLSVNQKKIPELFNIKKFTNIYFKVIGYMLLNAYQNIKQDSIRFEFLINNGECNIIRVTSSDEEIFEKNNYEYVSYLNLSYQKS